MKRLVSVVCMLQDHDSPEFAHFVVDGEGYFGQEQAQDLMLGWLRENDCSEDIYDLWYDVITEVDGHKIKVMCKPQERSEQ